MVGIGADAGYDVGIAGLHRARRPAQSHHGRRAAHRHMVEPARRHAQVLDELITDVLEMSSIDSGRLSPELQILDLAPLLRDEMQRLAPLAERRQQQLTAGGDA